MNIGIDANDSYMKKFKPYFPYLKPVKAQLIIGVIVGVIGGATFSAGLPLMMEQVFPVIFTSEETGVTKNAPAWLESIAGENLVLVACLMLPAIFMVSGICKYLSKVLLHFVGLRVLEDLRVDVYDRLQRLSLGFHGKQSGGDLLSRVMGDTQKLQSVLSKVVMNMIVLPGALLGSIGVLIHLCLKDSSVIYMLIGLMTVPETANFVSFNMGMQKYRYLVSPSVEIMSAIGVGIAIYFGSINGLTLEKFIPTLIALFAAYEPVKKLGNLGTMIREGEASLERLEFILQSQDEIIDSSDAQPFGEAKGDVAFKNCQFSYADEVILDEVDISVKAGETIALVGESGAGKSTMISLIPRFFEVQRGEVTIDGINVNAMSKSDLRKNIALVSQQPLLFRGTVAENILIGRPGATQEELIVAAKNASAHDFITSLPNGYNTELGERGGGLSGGQCQRVVIARAFLKDAPILILDEATSALDSESEANIQKSLKVLSRGRTTFIVAHRFSTIRDADRILVFEKTSEGGRIVADGPHLEIYESCASYKALYDKQN